MAWPDAPHRQPQRGSPRQGQRVTVLDPTASPLWPALHEHARRLPSLADLLDADEQRYEHFRVVAPRMQLDLSRQRWDSDVRRDLVALAEAAGLDAARTQLFTANRFNVSENRAVLHTALRAPAGERIDLDGMDVVIAVQDALARMRDLSESVRTGTWRGATGRAIRDVVNIGIGGSFLGPALVCDALGPTSGPQVHFLANIDGEEAARLLPRLDPTRTLFIIASKSFGTLETQVNARTVRAWLLERGIATKDLRRHFVAISTNIPAAAEFGLPEANLLPLWDWVGGRYSVTSTIGLPIALGHGFRAFERLLVGTRAMDEHFRDAPLSANGPVLLALVELWNQNVLGTESHAVLPYARALELLPDYLQQLEMESNGKGVRRDGTPVTTRTGTILWGNVGTNGQHAYHQLLHQGTAPFSAEFILPLDPGHALAEHHRWLAAHCFAQAEVFARGRGQASVQAELQAKGMTPHAARAAASHRAMPGNHPSTLVLLDDLAPESLGALIALHEHKVFVQGMIWGINSFDQWGVELGKVLGTTIHDALASGDDAAIRDTITRDLIALFRARAGSD
ncbi:MAG: glucose-6-phosphate isomerase [Gammaproteobacteria bacterium]|nr:MAG: glucose-6-phosphate isomerase [Gammaproteobacteria bacterium]